MRLVFSAALLMGLFFSTRSVAQPLTQTVRGTVVDQSLQTPIPGATIVVLTTNPVQGALTDADGSFRLTGVRVGRQTLKISFVGYKDALLTNVVVDAGKELVLTVALEEAIGQLAEVTVKPTVEKDKPLNEMATVSARTFSVEETQRFAAAINDPARMATAYAGVVGASDGNNIIVIRGNTPNGLLWRMEGVEIPNPNHFANVGTASGGISILSAQLLANSDFMTGAFPAEYGNALSGVFDLRLRRGNNQRAEHTVQAGVLGVDVSSEGPFSKKYKGSYLFNYRYSTLGLLSRLGLNVGTGVTTFQDFSFNVYLPTAKAGTLTLFGFGGLSSQDTDAVRDSTAWKNAFDRYNERFSANTGAVGLTHSINFGRRAFLKTVVSGSGYQNKYAGDYLLESYALEPRYREQYTIWKSIVSSTLTYKLNTQHTIRAGLIGSQIGYDLSRNEWDAERRQVLTTVRVPGQTTQTLQAFAQWNYRLSEQLTLNAGLHYLRLFLNGTDAVEPRGSVRWAFRPGQSLSLGYGLHSQMQNPAVLFASQQLGDVARPLNRNLGFTRSHHLVLAYDRKLTDNLRLKAETYYQSLFNIPVSADTANSFALINYLDGLTTERLTNTGLGRNYGLELTLEQFLNRGVYFLLSSSLYRSEYRGSDEVWRSSRFDGRHATSFLAGKEFTTGDHGLFRNGVVGLNLKLTYYGGYRDTPIDVATSQQRGETVRLDHLAYTERLPDYFRTDIRLSWKKNRPHSTRTLSLDVQNVTNRLNVFNRYFDAQTGTIRTNYQNGLLPVLSYRVVF
ncbi:TonB-dependent receptor [Spirosoma montaniterrae]|uniref:TonB-dependent receptor n=1 Tax=Spirosoma montaniterrae TaxID=1178516 RepID=A0A1P9WSQ9_9BACT|nr:TonB-dependent receptor [Spirosoma montaniterrae]AQG78373.1 TonB-dependent receptor [Spirosoma montaniterrae]